MKVLLERKTVDRFIEDELDVYDAVRKTRELTAEELLRYTDLIYLRVYLYSRRKSRKRKNDKY